MMKLLPMPQIVLGESSLDQVVPLLDSLHAGRIMVVTDPGIIGAGLFAPLKAALEASGRTLVVFDAVEPDPDIGVAAQAVDWARQTEVEAVIGLGGGSSLDVAKVTAALVANPGEIEDYLGVDLLKADAAPLIAIPTTAGTGSEVTPIAILSDAANQLKKGMVSARMMPRYAILDPHLTVGLPPVITAVTGMDAMIHALESFTSLHANAYTEALSLKAIELIAANLRLAFREGSHLGAREAMMQGSLLAGMAFANAGVAAAHALAYPLGGMFHLPHGLATSFMLLPVMRFNLAGNEAKYRRLARALTGRDDASAEDAIVAIERLMAELELPHHLKEAGVPAEALPVMAAKAMEVTRLLDNNPRKLTVDDVLAMYRSAYGELP